MEKIINVFTVTALKRDVEKKWTVFENIASLSQIAATLYSQNFDYAVIYDQERKYKLGSWNKRRGIVLYKTKAKVEKRVIPIKINNSAY